MRVFYITFVLSVALIVGGFFCPPIGQIDGSVLTAVGLLILFVTIAGSRQSWQEYQSAEG